MEHMCMCVHMHVYTCVHVCVHMCIVCMCVCMCAYAYMCVGEGEAFWAKEAAESQFKQKGHCLC